MLPNFRVGESNRKAVEAFERHATEMDQLKSKADTLLAQIETWLKEQKAKVTLLQLGEKTMKPNIRTALTADGNIEATAGATHRLVIDVRTGDLIESNVADQTDIFLWLVTEARKYMQRERHRDLNQVIARETSPENIWKLR